jgi:hypothetical protein
MSRTTSSLHAASDNTSFSLPAPLNPKRYRATIVFFVVNTGDNMTIAQCETILNKHLQLCHNHVGTKYKSPEIAHGL